MKNLSTADSDNPIREYWHGIQSGKLKVCKKIRTVYKYLVAQMDNPDCVWEYDARKANHAITFIETYCHHSKGKMGGKPLILELWQRAMVAATFGFVHKIDGTRQFTEVVLMVARKNGKSTLAAAIGLYMMIADQEPGAEVYAVATKIDQAKIIWLEAKRMVRKSAILAKKIKSRNADLYCAMNESYFRPLCGDSDGLDGLNVSCGLLDEIHAWKTQNLYDVIVDGTSSREQPLILITTTAGTVREGVFDIKYDEVERIITSMEDGQVINDRILPIIYELDQREEWKNPDAWSKANPGLGTIKQTKLLTDKVKKAKYNPRLVKNLVCKDFNIKETDFEAYMTYEEFYNPETFTLGEINPAPRYAIGGADLSDTTDLCSACIFFMTGPESTMYCLPMFWLPEDLLEQRVKEDKIPYDVWQQMGLLQLVPGNKIHPKFLTQWFSEITQKYDICLSWVGYDAWAASYWVEEMGREFGPTVMSSVRQGKITLSGPLKEIKADLIAHKINYGNNPILKWNMGNVKIQADVNNNIQPMKKRTRARIDGFAAMLNAYVTYQHHLEEYTQDIGG